MSPATPHVSIIRTAPKGLSRFLQSARAAARSVAIWCGVLTVLMVLTLPGALSAAEPAFRVLAVLSDEATYYHEVVNALRVRLAAACALNCAAPPELTSIALEDFSAEAARGSQIVIPLGRAASLAVARAELSVPTVYALIPEATWKELQGCCPPAPPQVTAVFLDQPVERHLQLVRLAMPGATRVGVLLGPTSGQRIAAVHSAGTPFGLELTSEAIADEHQVGPALRALLKRAEILLAVPDPAIYNRETIVSLLLTTYRARVPLVGYSHAMVNAGAALALYSTPEDIGRQLGDLSEDILSGQGLPAPAAATHFRVEVNREVARSLGLTLPDDATLARNLGSVP